LRRDSFIVEYALDEFFVFRFEKDYADDLAVGRIDIRHNGLIVIFGFSRIRYLNPLRLFNFDTKHTRCLLEAREQLICTVILSASINYGPCVFL
jgi:hypothetical protein